MLEDDLTSDRDIDNYDLYNRSKRSLAANTRSLNSNPQYSLDEEAEIYEKEKFKINSSDRLIIASFKLPIDVTMDIKKKQWVVSEGPVMLSSFLIYVELALSNIVQIQREEPRQFGLGWLVWPFS